MRRRPPRPPRTTPPAARRTAVLLVLATGLLAAPVLLAAGDDLLLAGTVAGALTAAVALHVARAARSATARTAALALAAATGLCALGDAAWWFGALDTDPGAPETPAAMVPYVLRYVALAIVLTHAVPPRDGAAPDRTARRLHGACLTTLAAALLLLLTPLRDLVAATGSTAVFTTLDTLTATGGAVTAALALRLAGAARRAGVLTALGTVGIGVGDALVVAAHVASTPVTPVPGALLVLTGTCAALLGTVTAPPHRGRAVLPRRPRRGRAGLAGAVAAVRVVAAGAVATLAGHAALTGALSAAAAGTAGAAVLLAVLHSGLTAARSARAATAEDLAARDEVTDAWSRRGVLALLHDDLAHDRPGSVVLLDLDGFKAVNDTFGHAVGDDLLAVLVHRWGSEEGVGAVGRLGGDEFVVLTRATGADLRDLAVRLRRAAALPCHLTGGVVATVGASAGWAEHPADGPAAAALLALADERMYADKADRRRGGDRRGAGARPAADAPADLTRRT